MGTGHRRTNAHRAHRALRELRRGETTTAGYFAGWALVGALPGALTAPAFRAGADLASAHGTAPSTAQLRRNLARVVGPENVTADLVAASMRSYARYWEEAFRLGSLGQDPQLVSKLGSALVGRDNVEASLASGRGMVLSLPHSGNWDMAGYFLVNAYSSFTTVAERVKPESLFDAFVDYRESMGFEVLAHAGGNPPFPRLAEVLRSGGIVALLGERDLKASGVSVDFFGEQCTMPVGAVKLARDTGAALHVVHSWFEGTDGPADQRGWGLSCSPEVPITTLEDTMQRVADGFAANIAAHPADWHMLQPLWPSDVPIARREKAQRARAQLKTVRG